MYFCSRAVMGRQLNDSIKRLLRGQGEEPREIVTDKRSYGVAQRALIPETIHNTAQYANNRAELSHQPTRGQRARDEALQVNSTGAAISDCPRSGVQSFQPWTSSCKRQALQRTQDRCLWTMDDSSCLIPNDKFLLDHGS